MSRISNAVLVGRRNQHCAADAAIFPFVLFAAIEKQQLVFGSKL